MKEVMKKDRSRVQIAKMSCFGLLEMSRQRLHSSFLESSYQLKFYRNPFEIFGRIFLFCLLGKCILHFEYFLLSL